MKLKIDPELKSYIPGLTYSEREELKDSILKYGIRDPLVIWGDILIDGHHRYEIAQSYNLPFKTVNIDFDSIDEAKLEMLKIQLGRRNLTDSQRDYLSGEKYDMEKKLIGGRSDRTFGGTKSVPLKTRERIAEEEHVSPQTIVNRTKFKQHVNVIEKELNELEDGFGTEVKGDILSEDLNLTRGETKKLAEMAPKRMRNVINRVVDEKATNVNQAVHQIEEHKKVKAGQKIVYTSDRIKVVHADFTTYDKIDNGTVDAIITDPLYQKDKIYLWGELSAFATNVLKPGGWLIAYSGQGYLPLVHQELLNGELEYFWTFTVKFGGGRQNVQHKNLNSYVRPVIVMFKPPIEKRHFIESDFIESEKLHGWKTAHKWQKPVKEIEVFIKYFTDINALLVDPMAGSGSTLKACKNLNRRCIGIDIKSKYVNIMKDELGGQDE